MRENESSEACSKHGSLEKYKLNFLRKTKKTQRLEEVGLGLTIWWKLTHSLTHSLTQSINQSINQSITYSLTHSLTYLLTYLLTPWSRVLLEKRNGLQLVKKFPAFYGTRRFIAIFTSARQLSLSWATSIQSMPSHPTSWRSILILSSHLRLGLPSGLFLSGPPPKPCVNVYSPPYLLQALPIPFFSIWLREQYWWVVQIIKLLIM